MKTHVLAILAISLTVGQLNAQRSYPSNFDARNQANDQINSSELRSNPARQKLLDPSLVGLGSASNIWSILNPDQSQVDYNPELGLLTFVHRQDIGMHEIGGSGVIRYDLSTDMGNTWDVDLGPLTPMLVSTDGAVPVSTAAGEDVISGCRYPNGVIYNPPGNMDVTNAHYVSTGPCLFNTLGDQTGWGVSYYASQRLDGSDPTDQYSIYLEDDVLGGDDGAPKALCQAGDALHAIGNSNASGSIQLAWKGMSFSDGETFDWVPTQIEPPFKIGLDSAIIYNGYQNMAFSRDGSVGYFVIGGALENQSESWYIPNVYTTVDNGDSWSLASADLDIANTEVGQLLNGLAYTRRMDCVVDAAGSLHVFSEVMQSNADNTSFFYEGYMVDFVWNGSDWTEHIIGQIDDAVAGGFAGGNFQDLHPHPQASITANGEIATFIWTSTVDGDTHVYPDIFGRAVNTVTGERTEIKNLTEDTDAEASAYYPTAASTLITNGEDMQIEIPIVCFIDWSGNNLDPVQFYYLKGLGFDFGEFALSTESQEAFDGLLLYPNPANTNARLSFDAGDVSNAIVRVSDVMGRLHSVIAEPTVIPGQNNLSLDVSGLANGVYTVSILSEGASVSIPLRVQH